MSSRDLPCWLAPPHTGSLVRRDRALIQLLEPPFEKSNLNPGHIKGYFPGFWLLQRRVEHEELWLVDFIASMLCPGLGSLCIPLTQSYRLPR
jgi:hypothetical protein